MADLFPQGPTVQDVVSYANAPTGAMWGIALGFTCASIHLWSKHREALVRRAHFDGSPMVQAITHEVLEIMLSVPVFALTTFIGLFFPRCFGLFDLFRCFAQAFALNGFTKFVILKLGGMEGTLQTVVQQPPQPWYATQPFGCCFTPVCAPFIPDEKILNFCFRTAKQFTLVVPYGSIAVLWIVLEDTASDRTALVTDLLFLVSMVRIASTMTAMYGMQILVRIISVPLKNDFIPRKAGIIKLLIVFANVQSFLIGLLVKYASHVDENSAPYHSKTEAFMRNYRVYGWCNFVLCIETFFFMLLLRRAYPVEETSPLLLTTNTYSSLDGENQKMALLAEAEA